MINDPFHPEEAIARERETSRRMIFGIICAVALTAVLLAGYAFLRRLHAKQVIENQVVQTEPTTGPKGPALAHILVDQPLLDKGITTIGGVVRNTSQAELTGLAIHLELHRKNGAAEQKLVPLDPGSLQPQQEGSYSLKLPAADYGSVTLVGLRGDPAAKLIAFTSAPGKQRPPERLPAKTIVVRRSGRPGEFINTPDTPVRVP
jgi:hypothetical protein